MPTKLSTLLSRMDKSQTVSKIDTIFKVQELDEAIRTVRRVCKAPWSLISSSLKVFSGILTYNPGSDFDGLAFLDDSGKFKTSKPDFQYTSIKQFYEDPNNRNTLAEIWNDGEVSLGVNYKNAGLSQILVDDCSIIANYTPSGDFTSVEQETVETGNSELAVKATCVENTDVATITNNFTDFIDTEYKKKYLFTYVYFNSIPNSVDLVLKKDGANYLSKNILTQFDGRIFKAGEWNILAFDLNNCVVEGATGGEFTSLDITLNGVTSGTYYFGVTQLKEWLNLNYNYYSKNYVQEADGTKKEYFLNSETNEYDGTDVLIGEDIYSDVVLFEAMCSAINEQENKVIIEKYETKRQEAWSSFFEKHPELRPVISTNYYNYIDNADLNQDNNQIYV